MKKLAAVFLFMSIFAQAGQIGDRRISGIVKSFDDKSVKIESGGKLFEFDLDRVVDRKNLAVGKIAQISLENKK